MSTLLRLLLVEDNPDDAQLLIREIRRGGYDVEFERVETVGAMRTMLVEKTWNLIISDYTLPQFNAIQALEVLKAIPLDLPFIIVSGTIGEESAVAALKAGAHDFLVKSKYARLNHAIERELREAEVRREHRQREREVEAIASISMALRQTKTLDEMLPNLLDQTLELINAEIGSIWLYDIATDQINLAVQRGWNGENPITSLHRGEGIPGMVVKSGQSIVIPEIYMDPRVTEKNRENVPRDLGGACIPLYSDENIVGVIFINVKLPREISTGELRVLSALAEIGGNAIHRMYLLEKTLKQVERLKSLHNIDLAISSSLDLQISLKTVLKEVTSQLKVDAASVLLIKPDTNRLEFSAGQGFRTSNINSTSLSLGEGHAGQVARDKKIVYIKDLNKPDQPLIRSELQKDEGFVAYYGAPLISKDKVQGVLEIFNRSPLHVNLEWLSFLDALSLQTAIAVDNALLFESLQRSNSDLETAYDATIEGWSRAMDLRDKETEGHTLRVTEMSLWLASLMHISDAEQVHIHRGGLLHDIGKLGVPDAILLKPDKLNDEEWVIMRQHPTYAYEMLSSVEYLKPALDIPYCHHEKWDGTGYPRGLKGEQIPLVARIFAVVDVWDALRSDRPYRSGWPEEKVLDYIRAEAGKHFDPEVVKVFLKLTAEK